MRKLWSQELDRNVTIEIELRREVDDARSSATDLSLEAVATELTPGR